MVSRRGQFFFVLSQRSFCSSWSVVFSWSVVLHGQSFFLVVVVSRFFRGQSVVLIFVFSGRGQSFFVVSRLDRRGQSSWSVVLRGQSEF